MKQILLNSALWGVVLSLGAYWVSTALHKKLKLPIFNPILVSFLLTIGVLLLLDIDYDSYYASSKYLSYLLTPTTVCLAIPLYEKLQLLKKNGAAIFGGIAAGVLTALGSILLMGLVMQLPQDVLGTLLPKSVTTAIGMPLAEQLGGYPSITAITIVITGVMGNVLAESFLKLIRVTDPIAKGVAMGTASHSAGTSRAMEMGEVEGAMSGLALVIAGLLTVAILAFV